MKYRDKAAELLKQGKNVALYCDGLYSDTNILYLNHFYGVKPTVIIDNDPRKKGKALLDISVLPYTEAKSAYDDLYYYIQGNTYQYTIIGELLEDGVDAEHIINYVPVEKRAGCLISETTIGIAGNGFTLCYEAGPTTGKNHINTCLNDLTVSSFENKLNHFWENDAFFAANGVDCRDHCIHYKENYYAVEPRLRVLGDYNSDYCELACVYCFLQEFGMDSDPNIMPFSQWLTTILQSNKISDALVLHICPTEKQDDENVRKTLEICLEHEDAFESVNLFQCCYAYHSALEPLLEHGLGKVFWSLDAGTAETFERVKRKRNSFEQAMDNVKRYRDHDVFGGMSIIPKFCFVRGMNDNERDFDGFVEICLSLECKYCALQWNHSDDANTAEDDRKLIRNLYQKDSDFLYTIYQVLLLP